MCIDILSTSFLDKNRQKEGNRTPTHTHTHSTVPKLTCSSTFPYISIFSLLSSPKRSSPGLEAPNGLGNSDLLPLVHPRLYWKVWQRTVLMTNDRTRTTNAHFLAICERQVRRVEKTSRPRENIQQVTKKKGPGDDDRYISATHFSSSIRRIRR